MSSTLVPPGRRVETLLFQGWIAKEDGAIRASAHLPETPREVVLDFGRKFGLLPVGAPFLSDREWKTHGILESCGGSIGHGIFVEDRAILEGIRSRAFAKLAERPPAS